MPGFLNRHATPLITGLFLVSLVSGVALFFHWGTSYFREMHEILSLVLILPFVLHLWKNWRSMTVYFTRPAFAVAMAVSLIGAGAFAYQGAYGPATGGPPQFALIRALVASPVNEVAAVMNTTSEILTEKLRAAGVMVVDPALPLSEAGKAAGKDDMAIALLLARALE